MCSFAIFINTTDKFEDCWLPFFRLFSIYWPQYTGTIYLNTELRDFKYENLNIVCIKNGSKKDKKSDSWSECLYHGVHAVDNEILLYMQEDYFLRGPVEHDIILEYAKRMHNLEMDCIHLTDQHSSGPFSTSPYSDLWLMGRNDFHKISCQAALWKKDILLEYIRRHENPWQFEMYGTFRARLLSHKFFTLDRNIYKENVREVIPYIFTGIIQGKWYNKVVDLFAKHDINVEYGKRGFISDAERFSYWPRIKRKLKDISRASILEILKLKYFSRPGISR